MQVRPGLRKGTNAGTSGREALDLQRIDKPDSREHGRADLGVEKADVGMGLVLDRFGLAGSTLQRSSTVNHRMR
jgi:hypothetical protein